MKYIFLVIGFLFAGSVSACSFSSEADIFKAPEDNYQSYNYVLSVSIVNGGGGYNPEGSTYTFEVNQEHKGVVGIKELRVTSPGHSCGFFGSKGQHFVWFTNDLSVIDEATPKKFFETVEESVAFGDSLAKDKQEPTTQTKPALCTKEYRPVCGAKEVQCVKAPCDPVLQTYANTCLAEADGATVVNQVDCNFGDLVGVYPEKVVTPTISGPITKPEEGFVGPTTQPPYDNSPDANDDVVPQLSWYDTLLYWLTTNTFVNWITNLFRW